MHGQCEYSALGEGRHTLRLAEPDIVARQCFCSVLMMRKSHLAGGELRGLAQSFFSQAQLGQLQVVGWEVVHLTSAGAG